MPCEGHPLLQWGLDGKQSFNTSGASVCVCMRERLRGTAVGLTQAQMGSELVLHQALLHPPAAPHPHRVREGKTQGCGVCLGWGHALGRREAWKFPLCVSAHSRMGGVWVEGLGFGTWHWASHSRKLAGSHGQKQP